MERSSVWSTVTWSGIEIPYASSILCPILAPALSVEELETETAFNIYPNPSNELVTIQVDELIMNMEISVINALGQTVYTEMATNNLTTINTSLFSEGLYLVQLKSNDQITTEKLVIQH